MRIITAWQCMSPEVTMKDFKKYCISTAVDETDDDMLWNGSEEDKDVRSVRKTKAQTVKTETVKLKGR